MNYKMATSSVISETRWKSSSVDQNPLAYLPVEAYQFGQEVHRKSKDTQIAAALLEYYENPIVLETWSEMADGTTTDIWIEALPPRKPEDLIAGMPAIPFPFGDNRIREMGIIRTVHMNNKGHQEENSYPVEVFLNTPVDGIFTLSIGNTILKIRVLGWKKDLVDTRLDGLFAGDIYRLHRILEELSQH
jgi:hypothetical protein